MAIIHKILPVLATATFLLSGNATADGFSYKPKLGFNPYIEDGEMIEVGTSVRDDLGLGSNEAEILLSVSFGGIGLEGSAEYMLWYVARINTEVGLGLETGSVSSFDIQVRPMGITMGEANFERIGADILPFDISRDLRLNQELNLKVRAVEARLGWAFPHADDSAALLASVAVEALGYKYIDYVAGEEFHGVELLGARAELAERVYINDEFVLTAALGGSADLSLGNSAGFAVQSDVRSYLAVRLNVSQFMEVFAQGGVRYSGDTGNDNWTTVGEFLAGVKFFF